MLNRLEAGLVRLLVLFGPLIRVFMLILFCVMAWIHYQKMDLFLSFWVWLCEGILYLGFVLAYALRRPVVEPALRFREILLPPVCALLPFFLIYDPVLSLQQGQPVYAKLQMLQFYPWIQWILVAGTLMTLSGLLSLRGSFSILTEARVLVTTGAYRYVSHPMYFGEAVAAFASAWLRSGSDKWLVLVVFLCLQFVRLRNEEEKLRRVFPEYDEWKSKTLIRV